MLKKYVYEAFKENNERLKKLEQELKPDFDSLSKEFKKINCEKAKELEDLKKICNNLAGESKTQKEMVLEKINEQVLQLKNFNEDLQAEI